MNIINTTKNSSHQNNAPKLRVCTVSGTGEIGRNCSFIEYGNDILLVDCGFSFPGHELYGIDYIIPNLSYVKKKKENLRAVIMTHGHLDHTGALPYVLPDLDFPPIYAGRFANALIKDDLVEFELENKVKQIDVSRNTKIQIGAFTVTFIGVTHSIPNAFSVFIESPGGNVFFSGDYKIDTDPVNEEETDYDALKKIQGRVDLALMESTNSYKEGKAKTAREVHENIETVIRSAKGRIIIAAVSSIVSRQYSIVKIAEKLGKKVVIIGKSLKNSIKIAREQGYIRIPDNVIISEKEIKKYVDNQLLILCTGSQAENHSALDRISKGTFKGLKIKKGDLVVISASEIPQNVSQIDDMTDRLIRAGADLIQSKDEDIHESGHGLILDMKMMYDFIKAKNVMPIHGNLTKRYRNKKNFVKWGIPADNILLTDDGIVWAYENGVWKRDEALDAKPILIDGLGIGDTGEVVLGDRRQLAEFGMVCVVMNLSSKTKRLIGRPHFVSRGFVYVKRSQELMAELEKLTFEAHEKWYRESDIKKRADIKKLKEYVEKNLSNYIYKKTEREPMILPVIV